MKFLWLLFFVPFYSNSFAAGIEQALVLKHPNSEIGVAFVRVGDQERLHDLVYNEGYEVVMRADETGNVFPALGEIVPDEFATAEYINAQTSTRSHSIGSMIDIGVGVNIGITTGAKVRVIGRLANGLTAGVDLDAGTLIFVSDATVSGILGWSFDISGDLIRPYFTVGVGGTAIFALFDIVEGAILHVGAGVEWKPAKWVGIGIEGGENMASFGDTGGVYPYVRLTTMFYF